MLHLRYLFLLPNNAITKSMIHELYIMKEQTSQLTVQSIMSRQSNNL